MSSPSSAAATAPVRPGRWRRLGENGEAMITWGGIAAIAVMSFAGAFTHMHSWTFDRVLNQASWLGWGNAVISEVLPTVSFLSLRKRQRQGRSTRMPFWIFMGSIVLSLAGNLYPVTGGYPGDKYLLAGLPAISLLILSKMIFADLDYARKERANAAALAEREQQRAAALALRQEREAAALATRKERDAAALARKEADRAAALARAAEDRAAALAREEREHEAALADRAAAAETARLLEIERVRSATEIRRLDLEAEERRAEREAELQREARAEEARVAAAAAEEKRQVEASATAAKRLAELRKEAVSRASRDSSDEGEGAGRVRRSREATATLINQVIVALPTHATRDQAIKAVADAGICKERHARSFFPADWYAGQLVPAGAGGEDRQLRLVAND